MKPFGFVRHGSEGFTLPTILIASVVMLTVLTTAMAAVSSVVVLMDTQFYNQLGREAAESGMARAIDCLNQSATDTPQWSDASPLRPNTNCDGTTISGKSQYVNSSGNIKTSFTVGSPTTGANSAIQINAQGSASLTRTSNASSVWRTFAQTISQDSRYRNSPKIAGGAGWKTPNPPDNSLSGHLGFIISTDGKLYGYGTNRYGQLNDAASPIRIASPLLLALPAGVTTVKDVVSSGQGASFLCIIGNNNKAYCRGYGLNLSGAWAQVRTTADDLTVSALSINGYGGDGGCVISSTVTSANPTGVPQAYCFGMNDGGVLGANLAVNGTIYAVGNSKRFQSPSGVGVTKVVTHDLQTCAILTDGRMYCAGYSGSGQLTNLVGDNPAPVQYSMVGGRKVADVIMQYHGDYAVVHVLATDGTVWSTGDATSGDLGNGSTSGSYSTPQLFNNTSNENYRTGSALIASNGTSCIDNSSGGTNDGGQVWLYTCTFGDIDQTWLYNDATQQISLVGRNRCIRAASATVGAAIQRYACSDTDALQKFDITQSPDTLKLASANLCIQRASLTDGAALTLQTCGTGNPNSVTAQRFTRRVGFMPWKAMLTGTNHFCAVRDESGTYTSAAVTSSQSGMWCAGRNSYGQLMNYLNTTIRFPASTASCTAGTGGGAQSTFNVSLPTGERVDWNKISSESREHTLSTMVITQSGKVYGAGRNQFGKLGNGAIGGGTDFAQCSVVQLTLPSGVSAAAMSTRDEYTTYILGTDNRVYATGYNDSGQLGNSDSSYASQYTPVLVRIPRQATYY